MKELSLNILDIFENSVAAKSSSIEINIEEQPLDDLLTITIKDNGCGIEEEFLENAADPFVTTRTTRKVGMGLSLLKEAAEGAGGRLDIKSKSGIGTTVMAAFSYSHIDRAPLGDMGETISTLVQCYPEVELRYCHSYGDGKILFSTEELKSVLEGIPLNNPKVILWIKGYVNEKIRGLYGGV